MLLTSVLSVFGGRLRTNKVLLIKSSSCGGTTPGGGGGGGGTSPAVGGDSYKFSSSQSSFWFVSVGDEGGATNGAGGQTWTCGSSI